MKSLFYPRSVVIIGVSDAPGNMGRTIAENLDRFSFPGDIYLVGRSGGRIGRRSIYRAIEDIPGTPELAVMLIPAAHVPAALEACGRKGIRSVVIESGGFGEYAEQQRETEQQLLKLAKQYGIRFVGPNCISIVNLDNGLVLPFMPMDPAMMRKGPVSLISQSGGIVFGGMKLFSCENIGVNKLISMGNKLDLNENDYLEYLIQDPGTRIIGLYLESISDGRRLMRLAAATDKPIVVIKSNTGPASNEIARFHTSALAGNDRVCAAALAQAGMHRVHSLAEMTNLFKVFQLPPMAGPRLAVVGRSGGQMVMAADAADVAGFRLAPLPESLLQRIGRRARARVIRLTNPLDLGDVFDLPFYAEVVAALLAEPGIDGVLLQHLHGRGTETGDTLALFENVCKLSRQHQKPVTVCLMSERDEWLELKTSVDFPLFLEPADALHALVASRRQAAHRPKDTPPIEATARRSLGPLRMAGIEETFSRLTSAGVRVAGSTLSHSRKEALQAAERLGYPVALKVSSPEVIHKTDAGGVCIGLQDRRALEAALDEMRNCFASLFADGKAAFLVQEMASSGLEVILGTRQDPEFGPVVLFGLGGIYTELFQDVAMRVAPVSEATAGEMIAEIRGHALLAGFRGRPPADVAALKRLIAVFSRILIASPEIENLEINPLVVLEDGLGCIAVDARMQVHAEAPVFQSDVHFRAAIHN